MMNDNAVISYILAKWIVYIGVTVVFLVPLFIVFTLIPRLKKERWRIVLVMALLVVFASVPTVLGIIDISQQSYITESVAYYRPDRANTRNQVTAALSIQITLSDGQTFTVVGATSRFPYGRYTGTITYAERSKIVIDFVPD